MPKHSCLLLIFHCKSFLAFLCSQLCMIQPKPVSHISWCGCVPRAVAPYLVTVWVLSQTRYLYINILLSFPLHKNFYLCTPLALGGVTPGYLLWHSQRKMRLNTFMISWNTVLNPPGNSFNASAVNAWLIMLEEALHFEGSTVMVSHESSSH